MSDLPKPVPPVNSESAPFWEATREGKLRLPRCNACDFVIFYPRSRCPQCRSADTTWIDMSGRGVVYSYTVTRRTVGRFRKNVPFVIAYVELEEGPRMLTNVVDCDPEQVEVGMPVEVSFDPSEEGPAIPRFAPR
jgi:uncharacterized OB-fold protein